MAIHWDLTQLDITDLKEWWDRVEHEGSKHTNATLFESFVFRMMVLKPTSSGAITPESARVAAVRNEMYERALDQHGIHIPTSFIRRMIGLKTNIFPKDTDLQFNKWLAGELQKQATKKIGEW